MGALACGIWTAARASRAAVPLVAPGALWPLWLSFGRACASLASAGLGATAWFAARPPLVAVSQPMLVLAAFANILVQAWLPKERAMSVRAGLGGASGRIEESRFTLRREMRTSTRWEVERPRAP